MSEGVEGENDKNSANLVLAYLSLVSFSAARAGVTQLSPSWGRGLLRDSSVA